ncbi:uncharacterized protein LOC109715838 [Ananas comosus]|uniref:Uncharacterized protein LOC109715838 n=1 Tax=Ananas comosus TaxID=4615 RepID=A0A6P5FLU0_ANACO|nr:uncharacterized protein LOC109715838 [Ananas comosus]XP_020096622.1 uncharacterized protein LOC109715838 [Ananas comosus]
MVVVVERVITVEYLEPTMSRELLVKFPDAAALGFDYAQSAIWSPLVPRGRHGSQKRKLSGGRPADILGSRKLKKVKAKLISKSKKKLLLNKKLDFSPAPSPNKKGWGKALKAAVKRFKVHGKSPVQMMLPTL